MEDTNSWDDLRIEVICQANLAIAGSPRNSYRASVLQSPAGRALDDVRGRKLSASNKLRIAGSNAG